MVTWPSIRRFLVRSPWRALLATLPVLVITGYLFHESLNSERLLLEAETARQADNAFLQFQGFVTARTETLKNVGDFALTAPADAADRRFAPFARRLFAENPDFHSLVWKGPDGGVRQFVGTPEQGNRFHATDLSAAEEKAAATFQPTSTGSFSLDAGEEAVTLVIPLIRESQSDGWLEGTVLISRGLEHLFGRDVLDFWNIEVYDRAGCNVFDASADGPDEAARRDLLVERRVAVADQAWEIRQWPTPLLVNSLHSGAPARIVWIGFVATLLLAFANFLLTQHQARLAASLRETTRLATDVESTRRHLSDLVNGIDAAIWESDAGMSRFTFVNDYARQLLRSDDARWVSEPAFWYEHVHPDDRERALANAAAAQVPGETYPVEYRLIDAEGATLWVQEIITVTGSAGHVTGKRGVVVDITARVQAEEALRQSQKLESLGVLAGGIAHDFNNLLTTILGNAELLKPLVGETPSPGQSSLDKIERTTRRLAELTRQMLAYSGRGQFSLARVDLNAVIREMTELLTVSIPKNVKVSYQLDPGLPNLDGDASQIRQVVLNLLTNAAEAIGGTLDGSVILQTGTVRLDADEIAGSYPEQELVPGNYARLQVSDNGSGMTEETLARIFDPFFTTKFTGRGLGLAALRGIVRGHRGGIRIFSRPGEGTVFTIVFPALETTAPAHVESGSHVGQFTTIDHARVLVVDDEEGLRTLMVCALEEAGCTVFEAADGIEGIKQFQEHRDEIDVVVLDLTMPRLGGDEVFRRIHQSRPDAKVILCSGYTEEDTVRRFDGNGLAGFIEKPFKPSELIHKIGAVLATPIKDHADGTHKNGRKTVANGS